MITQCARCSREIEKIRSYEYRGNPYCEDCYMDILSPPKACDPWAVHSAKTFLKEEDPFSVLTPRQQNIVNYLKEKKEATSEEILRDMVLSEAEWRREFAVLRHMEVLGATKKEGKIYYTMFNKNPG
jgi:DNA-directed RNA polymerase subunit RPC12/RpoP